MRESAAESHLEKALALSKQGAYQAAISEYQQSLDSSPPPDIQMIACIGCARAIWFDGNLELHYDHAQERHINQAKKVEELCSKAIGIYLSEFASGKNLSNLPVRENYEYANELKLKAKRIETNASRCFIATAVYGSPLERA